MSWSWRKMAISPAVSAEPGKAEVEHEFASSVKEMVEVCATEIQKREPTGEGE
jgi:hypothetical protein